MQDQHVPAIGRYYWPAFAGATLFASTASDLLFMELAGHGLGDLYLPLFAGAFVALIVAETRDPGESTRWYWAAVIAAIATAAHLADVSYARLGVRRIWVCAALLVLLFVAHFAVQSDTVRIIALRLQQRPRPTVPVTDSTYWIALAMAAMAGKLASDFLTIGQGTSIAATFLLLFAATAATAGIRRWTPINRIGTYWTIVFMFNALATAGGDLLVNDPTVGIGLLPTTLVSGVFLASLLYISARHDRTRRAF